MHPLPTTTYTYSDPKEQHKHVYYYDHQSARYHGRLPTSASISVAAAAAAVNIGSNFPDKENTFDAIVVVFFFGMVLPHPVKSKFRHVGDPTLYIFDIDSIIIIIDVYYNVIANVVCVMVVTITIVRIISIHTDNDNFNNKYCIEDGHDG